MLLPGHDAGWAPGPRRTRGECLAQEWRDQEADAVQPPRTLSLPWPTVADLAELGFSAVEVAGLERVAEHYPHREWCDDERQWAALRFLRWRVWTGRVSDQV